MSKNEHVPVDPRPYNRATAIINFIQIVLISMAVIAAIAAIAIVVDWALAAFGAAVCK